MKRFLLFALTGPLLSIATFAQTPSPSMLPTPSPTNTQASPSPSLSPIASRSGLPDLPYMVEILASVVMLGSVLAVFLLVRRQQELRGGRLTIGPRHIQFVAVCLIVPTILILGLEQVLSKETTATLIGGLTGYLLSGLGKYEPPKDGSGGGGGGKTDGDDKAQMTPGSAQDKPPASAPSDEEQLLQPTSVTRRKFGRFTF